MFVILRVLENCEKICFGGSHEGSWVSSLWLRGYEISWAAKWDSPTHAQFRVSSCGCAACCCCSGERLTSRSTTTKCT